MNSAVIAALDGRKRLQRYGWSQFLRASDFPFAGVLATWPDTVGSLGISPSQGTAGNRPSSHMTNGPSGGPSVDFATDDYFVDDVGSVAGDVEIFCVFYAPHATQVLFGRGSNTNAHEALLYLHTDANLTLQCSDNIAFPKAVQAFPANTWCIGNARRSGTTLTVAVDGVDGTPVATGGITPGANGSATAAEIGAWNFSGLNPASPLNGRIAFFGMKIGSTFTDAARAAITRLLAQAYGISVVGAVPPTPLLDSEGNPILDSEGTPFTTN